MSEVHASFNPDATTRAAGDVSEIHARLAHQSLARPLSEAEAKLADALEDMFKAGTTDFSDVARQLAERGVRAPRGAAAWSPDTLHAELAAINSSLDAAYEKG